MGSGLKAAFDIELTAYRLENLQVRQLVGSEISRLMPQPYFQLHGKWMKEAGDKVPAISCRNGATVMMNNASGNAIPLKLQISSKETSPDQVQHVVAAEVVTWENALADKRLTLVVDPAGIVTQVRLRRWSSSYFFVFWQRSRRLYMILHDWSCFWCGYLVACLKHKHLLEVHCSMFTLLTSINP